MIQILDDGLYRLEQCEDRSEGFVFLIHLQDGLSTNIVFSGQLQSLDADGDSSSLWCVVAYKQTHGIHFSLTAYLVNVQRSIRNTRTGPAAKSSNNDAQPD